MKKEFVYVLLFCFMVYLLPLANAFEMTNVKSSYLPRETFQAELTVSSGSFAKKLTPDNFALYKSGLQVSTTFNIEQLANNKFFVYFNLPESYGAYTFFARDILYVENSSIGIKKKTIQKNFTISKPVYLAYSQLESQLSTLQSWKSLNVEENAMSLIALSYDDALAANGKTALLGKMNNSCFKSASEKCDVKSTALALMALNSSNSGADDVREWLLNAGNSIDRGIWSIITESGSTELISCTYKINGQEETMTISQGAMSKPVSLPDEKTIDVELSCNASENISARIANTYEGTVNNFPMARQNNLFSVSLNNEKCWGSSERRECDAESTAYALMALDDTGFEVDSDSAAWLRENAGTTIQKSIAYLVLKDDDIKNWLVQNQAVNGYFSLKDIALSSEPDILSTVFASFVLGKSANEEAVMKSSKAKMWLLEHYKSNTNNNFGALKETSFALSKIFPFSDIEPVLTINPAVFKIKSGESFTLEMKNYGYFDVSIEASISQDIQKMNLSEGKVGKMNFSVSSQSQEISFDNVEIVYNSASSESKRKYSVPVMMFPSGVVIEEQVNKTTIEEETLIQPTLAFAEEKIEETLKIGEKLIVEVEISNPSSKAAENIGIGYSSSLRSIINVKPSNIRMLSAGETAIIFIIVDANEAENGNYSGYIEIGSSGFSTQLPVSFQVGEKTEVETVNETASEPEESANETDESGTPKKSNNLMIIGAVLIALAAVAVALYFIVRLKKKKPQESVQEALGKIEEKYAPESRRMV